MINVVVATFNRLLFKMPFFMVIFVPVLINLTSIVILYFNSIHSINISIISFDLIMSCLFYLYTKNHLENIEYNCRQLSFGNFQNLKLIEREDELKVIQTFYYETAEKNKRTLSLLRKYKKKFDQTLKDKLQQIERSKNELIIEKNEIEKKYFQLDQLFTILESTSDALIVCDANRKVQYINSAFIKLTGYQLNEMQEDEMDLLRQGRYDAKFFDRRLFDGILKKLKQGRIFRGVLKAKRKNGKAYDAEVTITPIFNQLNKLIAYNIIERDVTSQEKYKESVYEKLKYDTLTGLLSREALFDLVQNDLLTEQEITKRIRLRQGLTFILFDIDKFKHFNQEYGYDIGDKILVEFSKRLKSVLIEEDLVARVDGNEFGIILTRVNTVEGAEKIKEDILNQLKISFRINEHILNIKCSYGISQYPGDGLDFISLYNKAEEEMNLKKTEDNKLKAS